MDQTAAAINFWLDGWHIMMYLAILLFALTLISKYRWKKLAKNHVRVYIWRSSGKIDKRIVPEFNGNVEVEDHHSGSTFRHGRKEVKGWFWKLSEIHTYTDDYPGGLFSFLSVDIRAIGVNEWDVEPMAKKANVKVEYPNLLYNLEHEKVTALVVSVFDELAEVKEKLQQALTRNINPMVVYVLIGLSTVASGFAAFVAMGLQDKLAEITDRFGNIEALINIIKGGLGL